MGRLLWSYIFSLWSVTVWFGIGAVVVAILVKELRYAAILAAVGAWAFSVGIVSGRVTERNFYQAKIQREIGNAVKTGKHAEAEALKKFDASPDDPPDDGFRRPDE